MIPRVLSIRQPYAWAICSRSIPAALRKREENRDWSTHYRGPVLLHTGMEQHRQPEIIKFVEYVTGVQVPGDLPLGGIVGKANLVDVVSQSKSPWFFGKYGFILEGAEELPFIPSKGQLGIYYPDAALVAALRKKGIIK